MDADRCLPHLFPRGLFFDSDYVRAFVAAIEGPVVLVGHSYGGAVITQASAELDNVVGLVYLAAFGLDVGDSCGSVGEPFPDPLLATNSRPTSYEAGAGAGPGPTSTSTMRRSARRSAPTCPSTRQR